MSRFLNKKLVGVDRYVPGEQPSNLNEWIKLNTNENPYECLDDDKEAIIKEVKNLKVYNDSTCSTLYKAISKAYNLDVENIYAGNGSDEVLCFCMIAFGERGIAFPDVTYSFYKNMSRIFDVDYKEIPLNDNFEISLDDYKGISETLIIANPNAPTGIAMGLDDIEVLLNQNKERLVIIDEAYADFGIESATKLISKYDNLLVIATMSKSRSLAGVRVGYAFGNTDIISDLNTVKFNFNPYNINSLSQNIASLTLNNQRQFKANIEKIINTRERISEELEKLGFTTTRSMANFIFAKCPNDRKAEYFYNELKKEKILVRYWNKPRIDEYLRITVGTDEDMDRLVQVLKKIVNY